MLVTHFYCLWSIPFNYLGCPIFVGKPKVIYFKAIADKIKVKLASWKGALLPIVGRVQLVKAIIHGHMQRAVWIFDLFYKLMILSCSICVGNSSLKVTNGRQWSFHEPLAELFNFPTSAYHLFNATVASFIDNGECKIPTRIMQQDASIRARTDQVIIPRQPFEDRLVWCSSKDGNLSAKQAYEWQWLGSLLCISFDISSFLSLFESFACSWSPLLNQLATAAVIHVLHSYGWRKMAYASTMRRLWYRWQRPKF
ncbi:ribonuclease H [Trifolium pratense]|uniref:Ribonuclease H n=1 Tax=Trifolium pratense TaxID=57577 RepID=A0A2K3N058_TRIPR|nr:ribonuclease H [Trifolium pratense]